MRASAKLLLPNAKHLDHTVLLKVGPILGVLLALFLAALAGRYVAQHGLSYMEAIVASVAAIAIIAALAGARGVRIGFLLWIWTLGLGYRTAELTYHLRLHPSEVLLWGLLALLVVQRGILRREKVALRLPRWVWLSMPFWIWGWLPGLWAGRPWDQMFAEFRDFLLLIPLFAVAGHVLDDRAHWRPVLLSLYGTGTWIAGMGFLEYVFPGIRALFPGFISNPYPIVTAEGFLRAEFSFWGAPAATFVCVLAVPIAMIAWRWASSAWQRLLVALALTIQIVGIFIGGYRSMWLLLGLTLALWAWVRGRNAMLAGSILASTALLSRFLPAPAQERLISLMMALQGQPVDSSAAQRWERAMDALRLAWQRPAGVGWAGAGWTHSDFVQVAANLGLLAGVIFAGAYVAALVRLVRQLQQYSPESEPRILGSALLLSYVAAGGILFFNGVQVLPQLILPVWLVWVLVEIWLRQQAPERSA